MVRCYIPMTCHSTLFIYSTRLPLKVHTSRRIACCYNHNSMIVVNQCQRGRLPAAVRRASYFAQLYNMSRQYKTIIQYCPQLSQGLKTVRTPPRVGYIPPPRRQHSKDHAFSILFPRDALLFVDGLHVVKASVARLKSALGAVRASVGSLTERWHPVEGLGCWNSHHPYSVKRVALIRLYF